MNAAAACDVLRGKLLIGLSGGADSMALTLLLLSARERAGEEALSLHAVHVNHGLRGEASDGDERFVAGFCRDRGLPLTVIRLSPPPHPGEDWARQARYEAYARVYREQRADGLVLAHHREDQAETVLLHLLRGSGLNGLTGMRPESERLGMRILRPLLDTPREALRQVLTDAGQSWREDGSNSGDLYLRNRVRHRLLPLMEELAPGAADRLARTAMLLTEDEDALSALSALEPGMAGEDWLRLSALTDQPAAIRARRLRSWLRPLLPDGPDAELTGRILQAVETRGTANLPGGLVLRCGRRFLHVTGKPVTPPAPIPVSDDCTLVMSGVEIVIGPAGADRCDGRLAQDIPAELLRGCVLRTRQPGDVIRPFGMRGTQSLQDYLVNRRIEAPFRDRIPLLASGHEVLWVCGVGAGGVPGRSDGAPSLRIRAAERPVWMTENT